MDRLVQTTGKPAENDNFGLLQSMSNPVSFPLQNGEIHTGISRTFSLSSMAETHFIRSVES